MKHSLPVAALLAAVATVSLQAKDQDPVVMKINGKPVAKSEFEYFYNKNNKADLAEEKTFDEYVDLFINYKLKVEEALSRGVDTTQAYITELESYRTQLAEPYLSYPSWTDSLFNEFDARRRMQVDASHILLMLPENASDEEEDKVLSQIEDYKSQLEAGASFDSLAMNVSQDPSAKQNAGHLGYFSALQMVYPFETAAYTTPVGGLSICRSRFGYHLIKVNDIRKDKGEVRVAHIMKAFTRGRNADQVRATAKTVIDSLYQCLQSGDAFAALATKYSDDKYTAPKGGEYPWLSSTARFPQEWLNEAFSLQNPGDYTKPFVTDFGYHLIQLLEKRATADLEPEMVTRIKEQLSKDPERVKAGQEKFLDMLEKEYNAKLEQKTVTAIEALLADTTLTREAFVAALNGMKKPLLKMGKVKVMPSDFAQFVEDKKYAVRSMNLSKALQEWQNAELLKQEEANLANKYPEYRNVYKEYHDGILLFDVSSKEVWDKASVDTLGLEQFFAKNRTKYGWDAPRFKGAFIECVDDSILVDALKNIYDHNDPIKASDVVRKVILSDTTYTHGSKVPPFHIVNGVFQSGDNEAVDVQQLHTKQKLNVNPKMPVVMTYGKILIDGPESYEDVKGAVIADYQNELEAEWIAKLRAKYPVQIIKKNLDAVKKEAN